MRRRIHAELKLELKGLMMVTEKHLATSALLVLASLAGCSAVGVRTGQFEIEETTIRDVHVAIQQRQLSCVQLIQQYLGRIERYNKTLGAILHINANALESARRLDADFAATGNLSGVLHCIPVAVKDAIDTAEMPSTGGSTAPFANLHPPADATVVARLRSAGAIILAKTNLDEFGRGSTGLSTLGGQTRNPYDITRIPGGSSGGSGVAVAANLTLVALAEETGVSIRNPAANANIVGIAATQGLVSREGVIPISFTQDRVGAYARTVADAATVLQVIAGYDANDPVTAAARGQMPRQPYASFVAPKGLTGARLGTVRQFMTAWTAADKESVEISERAIAEMRTAGAEIIDVSADIDKALAVLLPYLDPAYLSSPAPYLDQGYLPKLDPDYSDPARLPGNYYGRHPHAPFGIDFLVHSYTAPGSTLSDPRQFPYFGINKTLSDARTNPFEFRYSLNRYLARRGDANIKTLDDIINKPPHGSNAKSGVFFSENFKNNTLIKENAKTNLNDPFYIERLLRRKTHQEVILKVMADHNLDALVYPMKTLPASRIGGRTAPSPAEAGYRPPSGNVLGSQTGFPSIIMPGGFTTHVYDWAPDPADSRRTVLGSSVPARVPVGIEFLGVPFSEPTLLRIVSGYESVTRHRRAPADFSDRPSQGR
jgi:Asp-tRNA(Asn)/Glu-tRNA(Gln) amidotransferase A subunit family amidase